MGWLRASLCKSHQLCTSKPHSICPQPLPHTCQTQCTITSRQMGRPEASILNRGVPADWLASVRDSPGGSPGDQPPPPGGWQHAPGGSPGFHRVGRTGSGETAQTRLVQIRGRPGFQAKIWQICQVITKNNQNWPKYSGCPQGCPEFLERPPGAAQGKWQSAKFWPGRCPRQNLAKSRESLKILKGLYNTGWPGQAV